ncbi:MAG: hypothetical protein HYR84_00930 [Planctomycetes bacterium]|nr:hypothetical protein [Planctomycetota bacterium]
MSQPAAPPQATPPSLRQMLLGLFILLQLALLLLSNVVSFLKTASTELSGHVAPDAIDKKGHAWKWLEHIDHNLAKWAQLSGQEQDWRLFAPTVTKAIAFPCVLLLFDDALGDGAGVGAAMQFDALNGFHFDLSKSTRRKILLPSDNEPADMTNYLRVGKGRLRRLEDVLQAATRGTPGDSREQAAARASENVESLRDQYQELALAYVKQRVQRWKAAHPDEPMPRQAILGQRSFRIHDPEEPTGWDGPFFVPLLRWHPADPIDRVEAFDFALATFKK